MKVSIINSTPDPIATLLFTKSTRLNLSPGLWDSIVGLSYDTQLAQLKEMAATIRSSWEFVDLTFLIEGISRPCAQQVTRTRTGSYAMQSQRVTNVADAGVYNPHDPDSDLYWEFEQRAHATLTSYSKHIVNGATMEEARGLLPSNIACNLVAKYNLRSFVELVQARESLRTQAEYAELIERMKAEVLCLWPWTVEFLRHPNSIAIEMLEKVANEIGITTGSGPGWAIAKAIDLIRK